MEIERAIQEEFAKRDEVILALEMLLVDQASRLLALESIVLNMTNINDVSIGDVRAQINKESQRFSSYLEGEGLNGFIRRATNTAEIFLGKK
tara:strand:+ start:39546 stop:39821 length:276 start_codon:yes stop_codon:yes gene_type:complete